METFDFLPAKPITDPRELVSAVRDIVENHPSAHDQKTWIEKKDEEGYALAWSPSGGKGTEIDLNDFKSGQVDCGTTCCTAGWLVTLAGGMWVGPESVIMPGVGRPESVDNAAERLLDPLLTDQDDESCLVDDLFNSSTAPHEVAEILTLLLDEGETD